MAHIVRCATHDHEDAAGASDSSATQIIPLSHDDPPIPDEHGSSPFALVCLIERVLRRKSPWRLTRTKECNLSDVKGVGSLLLAYLIDS
jgi:hypothetical protein